MRLLLVGDVVGRPGRRAVAALLPSVVQELRADLVVANGENSAGGFGLTPATAAELFSAGVHVITTGNHVWDRKEILPFIDQEPRLIRPANFPPEAPGRGATVVHDPSGRAVAVLNLMGRTFMEPLDCPFRAADRWVQALREQTPCVVVDFHAEATAEKVAMGWYLDGRVSVVFGTHTHVPTADERILPGGTAYITDLGMTGPAEGVIGMDRQAVLEHLRTRLPRRFEVASGPVRMDMLLVEVDDETGRAVRVQRLHRWWQAPGATGEPTKGGRARED
ncbi:MAG TPA: TIGR00282 family metallophosphoesterase [Limnochordales bacterium]